MKKFFMTSSCVALALTSFSAYAADIKPFIGVNASLSGVAYSDDVKTATDDLGVKLPESFFGVGAEAGLKIETDRVYSAGFTFAYDYAVDSEADIDAIADDYVSSVELGFSAWSLTFDNYLRVSGAAKHRQDIVLGVGFGNAKERFKMDATYLGESYGLYDIDESDDGNVVVFKVGYIYNVGEHADLVLNGRFFVPTDSETDVDVLFNMSAGVRVVF